MKWNFLGSATPAATDNAEPPRRQKNKTARTLTAAGHSRRGHFRRRHFRRIAGMLSRLSYTPLLRLAFPYIVWRLGRRHRWKNIPWREYLGFAPLTAADARPPIWIHTVSIGEAAAAAEMTRQLQCYGCTLLLTHTTPAGREWLQREHPDATVTCLPLDFPGAARRFLRRTRPCLGIFVEAEYWPNLLRTAKASGIKLMLANGRLGAKKRPPLSPLRRANARRRRLF